MKFYLSVLITLIVVFTVESLLPWWSMPIACFVIYAVMAPGAWQSFLGAFISVFALWLILSLMIDSRNGSILTEKIASLFSIPSTFLLLLLGAFVGGITGGLAAFSGYYLNKLIKT